ncbi:hypothetical protein Hanom_Chr07g00607441 [Helianthus anomalus]
MFLIHLGFSFFEEFLLYLLLIHGFDKLGIFDVLESLTHKDLL